MGRAEEKYKYLSNRDKYDPDVREAVGNKSLTEKDANKVNKIQEMMRKEREKKGNRSVVTSENRHDFMAKKLGLQSKDKEEMREMGIIHEHRKKAQPHLDKHEASESKVTDKHAFYKYPHSQHEGLTKALSSNKIDYHHEGEM